MIPEQEAIAAQIIRRHKDGGELQWLDLYSNEGDYLFNENLDSEAKYKKLKPIKFMLVEMGLIEVIDEEGDLTRLTEKGENFKSFKDLRENAFKEQNRLERKDKADQLDLHLKQWQVKTKYLPYIASTLALIGTIISIVISFNALSYKKDQSDSQQVRQEIQKLKEHVNILDSLYRVDILLKIRK